LIRPCSVSLFSHVPAHLVHHPCGQPVPGSDIVEAGLSGDDEAGRHVQADLCHLAQVGAFAAQQLLVFAVALGECVNELSLAHDASSKTVE
jgi:hypothetical protein